MKRAMRHLTKIVIGLILAAGMVSCELFNVDVETTLSGDLDISVDDAAAKGTNAFPFDASTTIDPLSDPDVEEYADKIVDVGVDGVVAVVDFVSEEGASFLSGSTFTVANADKSASFTLTEDWDIEVGSTVTLTDLGGFYNDMADIIQDLQVFTLGMTGTSSKTGVEVTVRIDIETTITGNPF
jgi:hypothetical protein